MPQTLPRAANVNPCDIRRWVRGCAGHHRMKKALRSVLSVCLLVHTAYAVYCPARRCEPQERSGGTVAANITPSGKQVRESAARDEYVKGVPRISMMTNSAARRSIPPMAVCEPKRTRTKRKTKLKNNVTQSTIVSLCHLCAGFEVVPCTTKKIGTPCGVPIFFLVTGTGIEPMFSA